MITTLTEIFLSETKKIILTLAMVLVISALPIMPGNVDAKAASETSIYFDIPVKTGDTISASDLIKHFKVNNFSSNYKITINSTNWGGSVGLYMNGPVLNYKALKVGVVTVNVTISDNEKCWFPVTKDVKIVVRPKDLEEAINVVADRLNGRYLTANGKSCTGRTGHKSCKNCEMHNVLAAQWLHDLFPEITNWNKANFQQSGSGWTCWGGAQIMTFLANELLYGGNVKLGYKKTVSCTFTKNNVVKYAAIGDHIRLNSSHSVILLGVNSDNTIKVVDVNSGRCGQDNQVNIYSYSIKKINMKVYKIYIK